MNQNIKIKGLQKNFANGFKLIIDELDISENTMIVGANGSGKSSLLKIIADIYRSDIGTIETDYQKSEIIYFSNEDTGLFYHLSGLENLKIFGFDENDKNINFWSSNSNVFKGALSSPYSSMSQGMKKIVKLFLFLNTKACVYLLDEPFSNLDTNTKEFLKNIINKMKTSLFIIAEHENMIFSSVYKLQGEDNVK